MRKKKAKELLHFTFSGTNHPITAESIEDALDILQLKKPPYFVRQAVEKFKKDMKYWQCSAQIIELLNVLEKWKP